MAGVGARLRPDEWKSGDRLWLVELCAPFATENNRLNGAMVADLMQNVFPGRTFKMHVTDPLTGNREVKEIGA
ncbi:MAG: toxin-activating lysine-acyltransferase [Pseudomonadota bacterium]